MTPEYQYEHVTPRSWFIISLFKKKERGLIGEITDSMTEAVNIQGEPGASYTA